MSCEVAKAVGSLVDSFCSALTSARARGIGSCEVQSAIKKLSSLEACLQSSGAFQLDELRPGRGVSLLSLHQLLIVSETTTLHCFVPYYARSSTQLCVAICFPVSTASREKDVEDCFQVSRQGSDL